MKLKDICWQGIIVPLLYSGFTWSLECWQCLGEDCHLQPEEVERAEKKQCRENESCLKTYYKVKEMKKGKDDVYMESVTRSCSAGRCEPRDDFVNCTYDQMENPGCTQRYCCSDADLCNAADSLTVSQPTLVLVAFVTIFHAIYIRSTTLIREGLISSIPTENS